MCLMTNGAFPKSTAVPTVLPVSIVAMTAVNCVGNQPPPKALLQLATNHSNHPPNLPSHFKSNSNTYADFF